MASHSTTGTNPAKPSLPGSFIAPEVALKSVTKIYIFTFCAGLLLVAAFVGLLIRHEYLETISRWEQRQSSIADDRSHLLSAWLSERQGDTGVLASGAVVLAALSTANARPPNPAALSRAQRDLPSNLDRYVTHYGYSGIYVLDTEGHLVGNSTHAEVLKSQIRDVCIESSKTGKFRVDIIGNNTDSPIIFSTPVYAKEEPSQEVHSLLGCISLMMSPTKSLFPLLTKESVPTLSGETVLMRREGEDAVFISPLRNLPNSGPAHLRVPLNLPRFAARAALEGRETFGEFVDYRGVRVLASTRRIPLTGWGLVRKIDRDEVLAPFRRTVRLEILASIFLIAALAGALSAYRRYVLARHLKEEGERFRDLLESAPDAFLIVGRDGRIALLNSATEAMFGYRREELLGRQFTVLVPERFRNLQAGYYAEYLADTPSREKVLGIEIIAVRKDGTEFPVEINLGPVEAPGELLIATSIRDVGERKRAEEEIRKLTVNLESKVRERTAELEFSNKELEAFTYSVSHDLRAPLRHASGFAHILVEEYGKELNDTARHYLENIQRATRTMGELIDDLLKLSQVGRQKLAPRSTPLNPLVDSVLDTIREETEGRNVVFEVQELPSVKCDPGLVKQVFGNLLSNAVKFTRPQEHAVIQVGRKPVDGQTAFFVRDNGVGFDMKYADKLFGVFQRLHPQEDFEGTGVGLAIVQRIVHKHGGRIWAEGEVNGGATFFFTLGERMSD